MQAVDLDVLSEFVDSHLATEGWYPVETGRWGPTQVPTRFFVEDPGRESFERKSEAKQAAVMKSMPTGRRKRVNTDTSTNFLINKGVKVNRQASLLAIKETGCVKRVEQLGHPLTTAEIKGQIPLEHPVNRLVFGGKEALADPEFFLPEKFRSLFEQTGLDEDGGIWELPIDGPPIEELTWDEDAIRQHFYSDDDALGAVLGSLYALWEGDLQFEDESKKTYAAG